MTVGVTFPMSSMSNVSFRFMVVATDESISHGLPSVTAAKMSVPFTVRVPSTATIPSSPEAASGSYCTERGVK